MAEASSNKPFDLVCEKAITPGLPLRVTVVECKELKDSRQTSLYVRLDYADSNFITRDCPGCSNPTFGDEFLINLVKGMYEINVSVWGKDTARGDNLIGWGRILLKEVVSQGYDDSLWALQSEDGRYGGVIRLVMQLSPHNETGLEEPSTPLISAASSEPFDEALEMEYGMDIKPAAMPAYYSPSHPSISPAPPYAPQSPPPQPSPFSYMPEDELQYS